MRKSKVLKFGRRGFRFFILRGDIRSASKFFKFFRVCFLVCNMAIMR